MKSWCSERSHWKVSDRREKEKKNSSIILFVHKFCISQILYSFYHPHCFWWYIFQKRFGNYASTGLGRSYYITVALIQLAFSSRNINSQFSRVCVYFYQIHLKKGRWYLQLVTGIWSSDWASGMGLLIWTDMGVTWAYRWVTVSKSSN